MRKKTTAVCALACAVFLCACAAGREGRTDVDGREREKAQGTVNVPEEAPASADGQYAAESVTLADGQTADVHNGRTDGNRQDASSAVQMQGLMQGKLGGIGSGFLAYTLPEQDGEDYKICFFKEGGKVADFGKSISETDYYPMEMADYIFPDVRDNNVPIGKFIEIYFSDTVTIGEDGAAGLVIVASYDVNAETCYDTRIYRWDGTGYIAEGKLMQEFNEQYSHTQDYPVEELYHLSSDAASQSRMQPIGENQTVEGQDYYGDLIAAAQICYKE